MIKIVQFIHGLNTGGAETLVKDYALMLDKNKFDLTILCLEHRDSPYEQLLFENNIKVKYICDDMPLYRSKWVLARLFNGVQRRMLVRRELNTISPDIIHEHLLLNEYVKFSRLRKNTKIVYTQHFDVTRWMEKYPKEIKCLRWLLKNYDVQVIALNNSMKLQMDDVLNISSTTVFNNGIDINRFRKKINKIEYKKSVGISKDSIVIGHIGRFSEIKNHSFLVDVFYEFQKLNCNSILLMIGTGETMPKIKEKINRLGLNDKTIILSNRSDISELLRIMDYLVFPSFSEGMPVSLVEAQIAGLRCLVSDAVSNEIECSNLMRYKSIQDSAMNWAKTIFDWKPEPVVYRNIEKWDMCKIVKQLEQLYVSKL